MVRNNRATTEYHSNRSQEFLDQLIRELFNYLCYMLVSKQKNHSGILCQLFTSRELQYKNSQSNRARRKSFAEEERFRYEIDFFFL